MWMPIAFLYVQLDGAYDLVEAAHGGPTELTFYLLDFTYVPS